nr:tRNA lysidine(34) synthetase TilS [Massilia sp. TS11]
MTQAFARALDSVRAETAAGQVLAVAFSGGLDSSVLLHLARDYATRHGLRLLALHVHHGLSPNADAWLTHCAAECAALRLPFASSRVQLQPDGTGVEAAARKARYAALGALCVRHGADLLLTAHHQDDQAETILLQLARGSGIAGLCGMDSHHRAPGLLGTDAVTLARPLLDVARATLEQWQREHAIAYIDDESNADPRYARNALRHQVLPALEAAMPGFATRFARAATHARAAQRMLQELAAADLAACLVSDALDLEKFRQLSEDRANNLLRHWFAQRGIRMPSTSWLQEMTSQLLQARADANLCVSHPDCEIRRYRGHLHITAHPAPLRGEREAGEPLRSGQAFRWQGEAELAFPDYGGVLRFEPDEAGIDAAWLRAQALEIDFRRGGETLKLAANRPTRSLKQHYQALAVPAWQRSRLPIVWAGRQLLFAAGVGMDARQLGQGGAPRVRLVWQ